MTSALPDPTGDREPQEAEDLGRTRRCPRCGEVKPLEEFEKHKDKPFGRGYRCKPCSARRARHYYEHHGPERREYARELAQRSPRRRSDHARWSSRERMERHPEKERARRTLRTAVNRGKVIKPSACEECGVSCVPHGHHDDYSKPLAVRWLCNKCHGMVHRMDKPLSLLPPEG